MLPEKPKEPSAHRGGLRYAWAGHNRYIPANFAYHALCAGGGGLLCGYTRPPLPRDENTVRKRIHHKLQDRRGLAA